MNWTGRGGTASLLSVFQAYSAMEIACYSNFICALAREYWLK